MAFKPNYNQARSERDRLKREKKADKLKQQQERAAQRVADVDLTPNNETDEQS